MISVLSRKSVLFLCLGVFALLFGMAQGASAATCLSYGGNPNWQKADVPPTPAINDCTVTYSDPVGGSNLTVCQYRVLSNGVQTLSWTNATGACIGGSATLSIDISIGSGLNCSDNGENKCEVQFKAEDGAGNSATGTIVTLDVDYSPPFVSANNASSEWFQSRTVTISASDAGSDISRSRYSWDTNPMGDTCLDAGNPFSVPTATITVPAGSHWLYFCATDNAGNPKAENAGPYKVDPTAPAVTSLTINGNSCSGSPCTATITTNAAISIAWSSTDTGGSGINRYEILRSANGGGTWTSWVATSPTTDNPGNGTYLYGVHAIDNAGNCIAESGSHCGGVSSDSLDPRTSRGPITVKVDTVAPAVGLISPTTASVNKATPFSTSVSDVSSGIASCNLYVAGVNQGAMTVSGGTASRSYAFASAGTYQVHATCSDLAGNSTAGVDVSVVAGAAAHSLNVSKSGTGTGTVTSSPAGINCGSTCSALYASGTAVDLTASADAGSAFASWSGCNSMSGAICTVVMSTTKTATVTFNDGTAPTVTSFAINGTSCTGGGCPATVTAKAALNMAWTASDNVGGSGVKRFEVWRAIDNAGTPNWNNPGNGQANPIYQDSTATSTADNPPDGTYWYGIHAIDNANNCITEATTFCPGGVTSDGQTRTVQGPIKVVMDKTPPILAQVTAVPSPTDDTTPNYTFSSTESGAITYGGDCSSATSTASMGNNTVTFGWLTQGTHSNCTIKVTDVAGNPSSLLSVNSFTITSAPPPPPPNPNQAPSIQGSPSDSPDPIKAAAQITFSAGWNDPDGDSVTFFACKNNVTPSGGDCSGGSTNRWCRNLTAVPPGTDAACSYTTAVVDAGTKTYYAFVCDDESACSAISNSGTFLVDATAPTVTSFAINGTSCTGGACPATVTANTALNIEWATNNDIGGSGIQKHEIWRATDTNGDGSPDWPGTPQVANATSPYTTENPADGTYWYGIHAIDNANNCISEAGGHCGGAGFDSFDPRTVRGPIKVVMDKTSPVAPSTPNLVAASDSGSSNTDNITNDNAPTFTGTAEVGSTVKLYSDSVQVGTGVGGSYNITASSLANGTYNIKATATDAANNTSGDSGYLSVTIDTVVPQKPTCSPAGGTFQNKANNVTCSAEPGATIRYTLDGSSPILSSTLYSSPFDIASSAMLTVAAWDISGNRSATPDISYSFTILNNQAPSIQGSPSDSPDPIKANAPITFSVTWSDPDAGDLIKIHICKTDAISGQTQTCSGGSWCDSSAFSSISPTLCNGTSPASSGSQNYFAFACDDENACSSSNSGTFLVDTQAPIITTFTITPQSPSWANNASPSITVTWNVSDQGGSHLDRVRVYRAPFGAGCNDADKSNCSWVQAGSDAIAPNNSDNWNCGATCNDRIVDNPGSGTWWYGMHVLDKAQNETTESPLPGAKKALVDTINPSTAVTFPPAGTWFKDNFNATLDDSDTGGSGLATGASGCQYRFIGDNPSGQDTSSGDLTRQCDPVTKAITVGPSPDVCRYEGIGRCRVESKSFDAAGNTSGWQTMLFGVDFTTPIIGSPAPSSAQSGVSTTYSATLRDPIGKVTGCGFYWRAVGSGTWNTGAATIIDPIPCENDANCTVSVDHMFASAGSYETQFGCTDQATNTGWGGVTTVEVGSLSVGLNAVPSSGSINTLFDLVATVSGTMTGNINYKFDCTNDGAWELEVNNQTQNPYTAIDLCQYSSPNTYTAKVFAQRGVGAAEDTVSIPISSNSIPTTTNRSVDTPNPVDYCGVTGYPPVRVRWTFSDADQEDTQGAYQIQIFHGGDMVVDTGKKSGATQSYVFQSAGEQLLWNRTYTWQVRVWDSPNDDVSAFASGPQFTTPQHYYPTPNFSWSPALPSVQESVQFTDQTNFATGSTNKTWSWTFGDSGSSAAQNPAHSYSQTGAFGATLESSDNVGSCSVQKTVNISIPFPEWQEISPF